jgi:N-acetylmuramic acid 6-phosphate etherase
VLAATGVGRDSGATLDLLPALDVLQLINAEDERVPSAVAAVLPQLAMVVDRAVDALRDGHRIHYLGPGTSGRVAVQDAAELMPTFALEPGRVVAHHAGGLDALVVAVEDVEDDEAAGRNAATDVQHGDVVVGLAASGRTPYVRSALAHARTKGAFTVLVSANPGAEAGAEVEVHLGLDTGPEVITGSTRMKAATAQKLVLHSLSTAVMVRLGRTYSNLMVGMVAVNAKLRGRLVAILVETGYDADMCAAVLARADGDVKVALVVLLSDVPVESARITLDRSGGVVRAALTNPPLSQRLVRATRADTAGYHRGELMYGRTSARLIAVGALVALAAACAPSTSSDGGGDGASGERTKLTVWPAASPSRCSC